MRASNKLPEKATKRENLVASAVDILSIMFAYRLGLSQLGLSAGIAYGIFDAWLVIWQRERIIIGFTRLYMLLRKTNLVKKKAVLPWIPE